MTTDQLKKLWNKGSKVKSLSEIDPKLPDTELSLFGPGTDSGTFDFFTDEINGEEGVSREDYQPSEDDNMLVQGVEGETAASATSASPTTSRTRTSWTWWGSTAATAASSRPPRRSRTAATSRCRGRCSCTRATRRSKRPEVKAFMDYVIENYQAIAEASQIVPLTEEQAAEAKTALGAGRA